jgi:hypothetical protein
MAGEGLRPGKAGEIVEEPKLAGGGQNTD